MTWSLRTTPACWKQDKLSTSASILRKVDGAEKMKFDYRMRPGPTPTTNALKLLELVGCERNKIRKTNCSDTSKTPHWNVRWGMNLQKGERCWG